VDQRCGFAYASFITQPGEELLLQLHHVTRVGFGQVVPPADCVLHNTSSLTQNNRVGIIIQPLITKDLLNLQPMLLFEKEINIEDDSLLGYCAV
jgi:hypothetical protein